MSDIELSIKKCLNTDGQQFKLISTTNYLLAQNIEHKNITTRHTGSGQAQQCSGIEPNNGTPIPSILINPTTTIEDMNNSKLAYFLFRSKQLHSITAT